MIVKLSKDSALTVTVSGQFLQTQGGARTPEYTLPRSIAVHPLPLSAEVIQTPVALPSPISILLRREDEELGPGQARAGYRVSGSGLAWDKDDLLLP